MKQTILIVEDVAKDYKKVINELGSDYEYIPENMNEFNRMKNQMIVGNINEYIKDKIEKSYESLRLIICDLRLINNDEAGEALINFIRNQLEIQEKILLPRLIPIIILTAHSDQDFAKQALKSGATHNIFKGHIESIHFKQIIISMINYYRNAYLERDDEDLRKGLKDISTILEKQDKLIKSSFGNLEILINGNHEETIVKFDLLFNIVFSSFKTDTQQKIFDSFKSELTPILKDDLIGKIEQKTWDKIKIAIKESNKGGGFKAFVDTTYDLLNDAGILEGKNKLIGVAIKGIFGVLAS